MSDSRVNREEQQAAYDRGEGFCPDCENTGDHSRICPLYQGKNLHNDDEEVSDVR